MYVFNSLGGGHTDTNIYTDFPDKRNFKKPAGTHLIKGIITTQAAML